MNPVVAGLAAFLLLFSTASAQGISPRQVAVALSGAAREAMARMVSEAPDRRVGAIQATGSMKPTLDERHIVIVEKRSFAQLAKGQIALFTGSWTRDVIAHRLVEAAEAKWITKGDNLSLSDPYPMTYKTFTGFVVVASIDRTTGAVNYL